MLIKVRRPQGSWKLFDEARDVIYLDEPVPYRDLQSLLADSNIQPNVIFDYEEIVGDPQAALVQCVEFIRYEQRIAVVFNTICFICNDQGRTLEKVKL